MQVIKHTFAILCLLMLTIFTNSIFSYQRQNITNNSQVKGLATYNKILPYPVNSIQKSYTISNNYSQETIKSDLNYSDINDFYKNLFNEKTYENVYYQENNNFINAIYKSKDAEYNIIISKIIEDNKTTLIIEKNIF